MSVGGGTTPRWSREGAKLFYRKEGNLFAVEIDAEGIGSPSLVWTMEVDAPFEILPDGGFLVAEKRAAPREIIGVSNFIAELSKEP